MVHALGEIWRTLKPGGVLLDLRPIHTPRPLEIVTGNRVIALDTVDYSIWLPGDRAADAAIRQVIQAGQYSRQRQAIFDYAWYWNTVLEMQTYFEDQDPEIVFSGVQIARFRQQLARSGAGARLRMQVSMWIGLYRKAP